MGPKLVSRFTQKDGWRRSTYRRSDGSSTFEVAIPAHTTEEYGPWRWDEEAEQGMAAEMDEAADAVVAISDDFVPGQKGWKVSPGTTFLDACRVVVHEGYTPVQTDAYERLRAWLDVKGWPPADWQPAGGEANH